MFLLHPYFVLVWCQHSTNGRNLHKTRHQVCRVNCDKKRFSFTDAKEDCSPPWALVQSNGRRKEKEHESSSLNVRFAAEGEKSCEEMMQSPVWKCLREVWMYKQALTSPGAQRPPGFSLCVESNALNWSQKIPGNTAVLKLHWRCNRKVVSMKESISQWNEQ